MANPAPTVAAPATRRAKLNFSVFTGLPIIPIFILSVLVLCAIFGNQIAPHNPTALNLGMAMRPPAWLERGNWSYPLGTDNLGRDILSRIIAGARISVIVALYAIVVSGGLGAIFGMIAGYFGRTVDTIIMRIVDIQMSVPALALALVLATLLRPSLGTVLIVIGITYWSWYARIIRAEVISLKERDYVALAKIAGVSTPVIFIRHLLPNVMNTLLVLATLQVGQVIIFEASLSFLGLGIQNPQVSWGLMLADARSYITVAWWAITMPGIAIMLTCLAANLFGDWMRDTFDPQRRQV